MGVASEPDAGPDSPHVPKLPAGWIAQWDSRSAHPNPCLTSLLTWRLILLCLLPSDRCPPSLID
jgi:hypothetical protein